MGTANGEARVQPSFQFSRWLFLRLVAVVYLLAFGSLAPQLLGLIGSDGLLPIEPLLGRALDFYGTAAYYEFPTLVWLGASDPALLALCWTGIGVSAVALVGVAPLATFPLLWLLYLSLTVAGQTFLSFQWDVLLLETGLLASLYAPPGWKPRLDTSPTPPATIRWLIWGLVFKLTLLSGVTKLASGDPTWSGLTALTYHYQTQPLPAWTSWFAHHAPLWFHQVSALLTFVIELVAPFGALLPSRFRRTRAAACAVMCLLQIGIGLTGNYGFFNVLTIALYLSLLDDQLIVRLVPKPWRDRVALGPRVGESSAAAGRHAATVFRAWRAVVTGVAPAIAVVSALTLWHEATYTQPHPEWSTQILRAVRPLRSINGYGLFRSMTTVRPELVVEASLDGRVWKDYEFRWKPGDPQRRPRFVQPHMPRLDWQMWFAALDPAGNEHWLRTLLLKLLEDSNPVINLLGEGPFPGARPRYVRLALYRYEFTAPEQGRETGAWWRRDPMGHLTESITLPAP